jgi:predicted Zn-dependent protease
MLTPHYDPAAEARADGLAGELLARSGFNPAGMLSAWRKVAQSSHATPPGLPALHPVTQERMAELEASMAGLQAIFEATRKAAVAAAASEPKRSKPKSSQSKERPMIQDWRQKSRAKATPDP